MKLGEIPRNDVPRALRYVEEQLDTKGQLSSDDAHVLRMLQDDPDEEYAPAFEALMKKRAEAKKPIVTG